MKRRTILLIFFILTLSYSGNTYAQEINLVSAKTEIEQAALMEQTAFETGDCDSLMSFFDDKVSFYANGHKAPSKGMIAQFCKNIPRPFKNKSNNITLEAFPLTENSGYTVRTFRSDEDPSKIIEVVTKIWKKAEGKWKIVHFHSTVE